MSAVQQLVLDMKEAGVDCEFYPTSPRILDVVKRDMDKTYYSFTNFTILDCGAGNGSALEHLSRQEPDKHGNYGDVKKFAIEKCPLLIDSLPDDVFIIGTDFKEQSLMDMPMDVIFTNPPYTEFELWVATVVRDSCASYLYFVIPSRWVRSKMIQEALDDRGYKFEVLDTDNFYDADRQARCEVDIIRCHSGDKMYNSGVSEAFSLWFNKEFKIEIKTQQTGVDANSMFESSREEREKSVLVEKKDIVSMLVAYYQKDIDNILETYRGLEKVDAKILGMLSVDLGSIRNALAIKVKGLKVVYWKEVMNSVESITNRFTSKIRRTVLKEVVSESNVDFTKSNIHAVLIWLVKHVNKYAESQIVDVMTRMVDKANVIAYKSNQKTIRDAGWRYTDIPSGIDRYKLDYRIVMEGRGYSTIDKGKLSNESGDFFDDLCAVAISVGFDTMNQPRSKDFYWEYGKAFNFTYKNHKTGEVEVLFVARRFKNGNKHITFNKRFICALNVAFGRIKGWIGSPQEASEEMDMPVSEATLYFEKQLKVSGKPLNMVALPNKKIAA